ncbi:hypothetical protein Pcinc_035629 [Petrolisthes cinctipes]|uniref:Uncharacterized protein n=1 Tax=Petrolisthes cinctipes TaxID=88211 RepID=A0AAE1C0G8_PETCI|nr:hypothetical protein Pcinc_035629 [Petrolisthes cinctipes]
MEEAEGAAAARGGGGGGGGRAGEPSGDHKPQGQPLEVRPHLEEHYTAGASVLIINALPSPPDPPLWQALMDTFIREMIRWREALQIPSDLHPLYFP